MMQIACVLRSGGDYTPRHVYALQKMCSKFMPDHDFVCLSDVDLECDTIPLRHDWPGWWSKLELFSIVEPTLYLDLDTVLVGDCADMVEAMQNHDFVILRDVYRGRRNPKAMQSSVMYWGKPHTFLYDEFVDRPMYCVGGDQIYLEHALRNEDVTYLQDIAGGVVSFKADVMLHGIKPEDKIIVFHGRPRPWEQTKVTYAY